MLFIWWILFGKVQTLYKTLLFLFSQTQGLNFGIIKPVPGSAIPICLSAFHNIPQHMKQHFRKVLNIVV